MRRRPVWLAAAASIAVVASACGHSGPGRTVLHGVTVFDGTGAPSRPEMVVTIAGDRIEAVVPVSEFSGRRGDVVFDGTGLYAVPGLWDVHVHLSKTGPEALPVLLANGVTSVRDMGGVLRELRGMRAAVDSGRLPGPRIFMAGPMLEAPATLERISRQETSEPWRETRIAVPDTSRARQVVDSLAALGVDFIKIREYASEEVYRAVVEAASRRGLRVAGHAPYSMDPIEAARLGLVSFEHASYPYPLPTEVPERRAILEAFARSGVAIVPTLVAWETNVMDPDSLRVLLADSAGVRDPRRRLLAPRHLRAWTEDVARIDPRSPGYLRGYWGFIDRMSRDLGEMHAAGVLLLPGSDLASPALFPGYALHDELERMVEWVGMSPEEVLVAATRRSAELLGAADSLGTIEPGKLADLVLLEADPLSEIRNTRLIRAVVAGGEVFDRERLRSLLRGLDPTTEGDIGLSRRP